MKTGMAILAVLALSSVASAQNPDPAKWMCRNLADSGGFVYQGESVFGNVGCRPIPQAGAAPPRHQPRYRSQRHQWAAAQQRRR